MKLIKLLAIALSSAIAVSLSSCDKEEENTFFNEPEMPEYSSLRKPKLDKYLTTTDLDGFSLRVRFNNGGDTNDNMSCIVHWRAYPGKPSSTPKASDMNKHESMRQYGGGTKTKTVFDKSHAGYSGGTYIYYYFECSNSKYTTETDVTYTVVKR